MHTISSKCSLRGPSFVCRENEYKMSQSTRIILRKLDITCLYSLLFPESYLGNFSKSFPEMFHRADWVVLGICFEILEIHYCNHQYPLRISSQNIVFVPGELSGASTNRYVFVPYQFDNTFLGLPENVRRRSVENTRTESKFNVCNFCCTSASGDEVDASKSCLVRS